MTRRTQIICPVRDRPELTRAFLDSVHASEGWVRLTILDNGSGPATSRLLAAQRQRYGRTLEVVQTGGLTIYQQWNLGFERARRAARGREFNVLVTNNDVELPPSAIVELAKALELHPTAGVAYPDYDWPMGRGAKVRGYRETTGVLGDGGMIGACFMLAGDRLPWIGAPIGDPGGEAELITDTGYGWWFGDNHLARDIAAAGLTQLRCVGLPMHHVNEGTARHHPELERQKHHDRQRWQNSQRVRGETTRRTRKHVPGTIVWAPGGRRRVEGE